MEEPEAAPIPRVTPYLLRRADDMCARRLEREYSGEYGSDDAVNRARLRASFLDAAMTAHELGSDLGAAPWKPLPNLEPEERTVFEQAVRWYLRIFGDRSVRVEPNECDSPTLSAARGIRIGGWVDLTVVDSAGNRELRQLDLWGGTTPSDPLDVPAVRVAVLRLSRWAGSEPLRVSWTDLVAGGHAERVIDLAAELPALRDGFDAQLATLRERAATGVATPGSDCGQCKFVRGCPHFPGVMKVRAPRRHDFRPAVLTLTPTGIDDWSRCPRLWRNRRLDIPASDGGPSGDHGLKLHAVLRLVHEQGDCRDDALLRDTVHAHGSDERLFAELRQHARRCPVGARPLGHEQELARYRSRPYPPFMATARIDAMWAHDGVLDARDYKSGAMLTDRVADDPRAWVQAWVLAPVAAAQGLQLRVRYEQLSAEVTDDPDPWEPDDEELAGLEERLGAIVTAMWTDEVNLGVADATVCRTCRYRSICPDSATPSEPVWPRVDDDEAVA